jgi:hypothetical protein
LDGVVGIDRRRQHQVHSSAKRRDKDTAMPNYQKHAWETLDMVWLMV